MARSPLARWNPSPNYFKGGNRKQVIIIHWWGAPKDAPSYTGVINHLKNPASQVSAHYVVDDRHTTCLVDENNIAWHALQANPISIGIECDPNGGEAMYRRLGRLVEDIRKRNGNMPLKRHSDYVATACPGTINLNKIDQYAKEDDMAKASREDVNHYYRIYTRKPGDMKWVGKDTSDLIEHLKTSREFRGYVKDAAAGKLTYADLVEFLPQDIRRVIKEPQTNYVEVTEKLYKEVK